MKISVIGAGSTYTPELVQGFITLAEELPLQELCLMDIDEERLRIVGGFAGRMVAKSGGRFTVTLSGSQQEAVQGASYIITQLRVGKMEARRADEYLGHRHGLIGQETTGVGGIAKALRTIPVILDLAADIRRHAPGTLLLNFTNPAGLVTEALFRQAPDVQAVGVCNVGINTRMEIIRKLEKATGETISSDRTILKTLGLNHLTWHYGFTIDGKDVWPQVFTSYLAELEQDESPAWDIPLMKALGMIPNYYLKYYYQTGLKLSEQKQWPPSRAEQVLALEEKLLKSYADPALTEPPPELMERGGAYYSTLATRLIDSHFNNRGQVFTINTRSGGAVTGWPDDWVLELPARVDRSGIHPIPSGPLPPVCFSLIAAVKMVELLTIQAAVHGDRRAAFHALLAHPLGPPADQIEDFLEDLLQTNRAWLPQFFTSDSASNDGNSTTARQRG